MKIALLEPYFSGSHRQWAETLQKYSAHEIHLFTMPGRYWKWRMRGAAFTLGEELIDSEIKFDLVLAGSMLDLGLLKAVIQSRYSELPVILYFHENQFAYPWQANDRDITKKRDYHYKFINAASAFLADKVVFNSDFNRRTFVEGALDLLKRFPDYRLHSRVEKLKTDSVILHPPVEVEKFQTDEQAADDGPPVILWNHRWEHDKNPAAFFKMLRRLKEEQVEFRLIITGENYRRQPLDFTDAQNEFKKELLHCGYAPSAEDYRKLLTRADILPVTSNHDFFGISVVEAAAAGVLPVLPRRLSYPELFSNQEAVFYNDDEELTAIMIQLCQKTGSVSETSLKRLRRFSPVEIVPAYDRLFKTIQTSA